MVKNSELKKSWIIISLLPMLMITACKDILPGGYGKISFKVDGVQETYKWNAGAKFSNGTTSIYAMDKRNHPDREIGIDINLSPDLITKKEYSGRDVDLSYVNFCVWYNTIDDTPNTVTITEIDSKHIKGTFSGGVYLDHPVSDECPKGYREITGGNFDVDFVESE